MLALSVALTACGVLLLVAVVIAAFGESRRAGLLALFVPGYVLVWGLRRMRHQRRALIVVGSAGCFALAALSGLFSTAFEPHVTLESERGADADFDGFEDLEPPPLE